MRPRLQVERGHTAPLLLWRVLPASGRRPKRWDLSIDHAGTGEGHIVCVSRKNQMASIGIAICRRAGLWCVLPDIFTAKDHCAGLSIQRHIALENNRAAKVT